MQAEVSVIIPTYNGAKKLPILLQSLIRQSFKEFELIVVVDGSTDSTMEILEPFKNLFENLRIIQQENRGRSGSRNAGARLATSDLLLFIDDDIELHEQNIIGHIQFHEINKEALLFGDVMMTNRGLINQDFCEFRFHVGKKSKEKFKGEVIKIDWGNYGFTSANLSISRQLFNDLGEFDSSLTDSEDFDLSVKALIQKKDIYFHKGLKAIHHDAISIEKYIQRQRQYYVSKIALLEKNAAYKNLMPLQFAWQQTKWRDYPKKWLMRNKYFWNNFFLSKLFMLMPPSIRYYLYSAYIYVHSVVQLKK